MESKNLIIRETVFSDCALFAEWEKKDYIQESFTMSRDRDYEEIVKEYVIRTQEPDKLQFTIVYREEDKPIGRIYISRIDRQADSLDFTRIYIGEEEYLGKGLGEEAMHLILEYCFIQLHMERVTLDYLPGNKRAATLYEKLGFQHEGVMRNAGKKNGRYVDLHLMSMLRAEYFEKCRRII
ncbi:MAG TPA: GNAT family protein [Bacillota bacterium]|jgi:ribosomal-protein-alanine N-acetyltransferase|nr:GNAT family protein [Bacillota bacterium]HQC82529.1 GNAT family protein [Bacillota bacterium]